MAQLARTERRRLRRVTVNLQMELVVETRAGQVRQKVTIVDMSLLGVRIRLVGSLVAGQRATLIPCDRSVTVYPCQVMWVSPVGSQFYSEAGLEFWPVARKASTSEAQESQVAWGQSGNRKL